MRLVRPSLIVIGVLAASILGCRVQPADFVPPDSNVLFRDEFNDAALGAGWTFAGEDATRETLTERPGSMRITAQDAASTKPSLLLRGINGDFVLTARMEFDPAADRLLAGLVVQGEDGRLVSLGLLHASGTRGTFRGVLALADPGGGAPVDRASAAYDSTAVYLRLERRADRFDASYSRDGLAYTPVGTVTTILSDNVQVGIGIAASVNCNSQCDVASPADFDFFEIGAVSGAGG